MITCDIIFVFTCFVSLNILTELNWNKSIIIQIRVAGNKIIGIPIALLTILIFTFDECSWYVAHSKFFFDFLFEKKNKKYEHKLKL